MIVHDIDSASHDEASPSTVCTLVVLFSSLSHHFAIIPGFIYRNQTDFKQGIPAIEFRNDGPGGARRRAWYRDEAGH